MTKWPAITPLACLAIASLLAISSRAFAAPAQAAASSNGKVGLAWSNGASPDLQYYVTDAVGWSHTWSPDTPDPNHLYPSVEFMPQLWGYDQVSDFENVVQAGYASIILGMNEPNEPDQSNMSPLDGAIFWQQYIEPKRALGYQTCTPATSSSSNGIPWMEEWVQACGGTCTFDYVCVHWYGTEAEDFVSYVTEWHDMYDKDIFITEFAPENLNGGAQPSMDDVMAFYQSVMPWIVSTSWIKGAFPFGFSQNPGVPSAIELMGADGKPTALGSYILSGTY